jgi:hypothetical protein
MKKIIYLILSLFMFHSIYATDYHVGPGQTYEELGGVPWLTLTAGDNVIIHWRSTPYASKIFIRAQGTAENPVIIRGVPNANGDLPVITGENATTNAQFTGYFSAEHTENLSLFLIYRGPDDSYANYKPRHIIFEYLEIIGTKPEHTFTDQFGNVRNYATFGTAINAIVCDNLTIRHCKIHDNSQGIFTNSRPGGEGQISRNLLIEYNEIWDNGNVADDRHHGIYSQAAGTIIKYNKIGNLQSGSIGSSMKDRSSGTIIRYNRIESSLRAIDLVESEEGVLINEPNYHDVYVYGNIILNDVTETPHSTAMIHFGFDNVSNIAKRGTLFFYHNTVFVNGNTENTWYTNVFKVDDDHNSSTTEGTVAMYNNILHKEGTIHLRMIYDGGTFNFNANNWVHENYNDEGTITGSTTQYNFNTDPILGSNPSFIDVANEDFALNSDSPAIDNASSMVGIVATEYLPTMQYDEPANGIPRVINGSAFDLGAFESNSTLSVDDLEFENSVYIFPNPTQNTVTINIENNLLEKAIIYNGLGQQIKEFTTNKIDISGLTYGVYFVKVTSQNGKIATKKIIKN